MLLKSIEPGQILQQGQQFKHFLLVNTILETSL